MLPEIITDTRSRLGDLLAARIQLDAEEGLAKRNQFSIALPGGSVARQFLPRLARLPLDWSRVDFFWSDERAVPESDPESNYGLARALWLDRAHVPAERIHRMEAEAADLDASAAAYAKDLVRVLGTPPALDVVLMGVGADGHVCSLFPGSPTLWEESEWVRFVPDGPQPLPCRLTLTLPTLTAARLVVVAAFGRAKAGAVRLALEDPACTLPLALALRRARRALVLLDAGSASLLSMQPQ
jgi:6-phosphogluconolactonase